MEEGRGGGVRTHRVPFCLTEEGSVTLTSTFTSAVEFNSVAFQRGVSSSNALPVVGVLLFVEVYT